MKKALIIVESPTKIKTLKKFLSVKDFSFASSVGHIRDLPKKGFGIDVENNFEPTYEVLPDKKEVVKELKKAAEEVEMVYLAPDPDREGEAIAWHIAQILPKGTKFSRVTFNAITKDAVMEAIKHPRPIDKALVNAQQARRLLDRIVGYKISPILQRRIRKGSSGNLSAGRVQSIALKLIVDREKEIEAFVPVEYWTLSALLKGSSPFYATLFLINGKKIEKEGSTTISDEKTAIALEKKLKGATYTVAQVEKKEKKRNPVPPFTTSTLQQEASRHFGFGAQRAMSIAQSLYEGVDLGKDGAEGLITYMRTDSVRVEPEAIEQARAYITAEFGKNYLPATPHKYATKKSAQDAHEAIRPTNLAHPPELIKNYLNADQFKLYQLIWRRFIASQMNPAIYDTVGANIETDKDLTLRASGSVVKFKGFLAIYEEKVDESEEESVNKNLPPLKEGEVVSLEELTKTQSFTKPPPRFTEASLVKELEKCGVGRPSTYASIMNKIHSRDYTTKERLQLKPTELGRIIADMLEKHFSLIMDIGFTAKMEEELDSIAESDTQWKQYVKDFWATFIPVIEVAEKEAFVPKEMTDLNCPECGSKLQKIWAKGKYFYGCSNYPECSFASPMEGLNFDKSLYVSDFDWDQPCPKCGGTMTLRHGRFGAFLGCSKYPKCKTIVNIPLKGAIPHKDLPDCPALGCNGKLTKKRSRFNRDFYSCSNYPDCDVIGNELDEIMKKYKDHPKTAYEKKAGGGGRGGRKIKPSKELAAVIGDEEMGRGDVTKKLWIYIKENKLQDPNNGRLIVPDDKLAKVFGSPTPVDMMKLASLIKPHLK
ncbi:MAG: type I DNA topoisomerase [Simkaniaceae bacterium]|nr:type I DNA topoisomerase [Simkaniaceae bacterium]